MEEIQTTFASTIWGALIIGIIAGILSGLIVAWFQKIYNTQRVVKRKTKEFYSDLDNFFKSLKILQQNGDISKQATRSIVIEISKSFGQNFKNPKSGTEHLIDGDNCWLCEMEYKYDAKKSSCANCDFNCSAWEERFNSNTKTI